MACGIYGIHNLINGKWYVGQSVNIRARWNGHRSLLSHNEKESIHLMRAWRKYGEDAFEWVVLEECSPDELDEKEVYWISQKDSYNNGYNCTIGGGGTRGFHLSKEHKVIIGERTAAAWADKNHRQKRLLAMHKSMDTAEYKQKLSIAGKRNWSDPLFKEISLQRMKKGMTNASIEKRRASIKLALSHSSTKEKLSKSSKKNWTREEYRQKMAESRAIFMDDHYRKRASIQSKERWQDKGYQELVKKNLSESKRETAPEVLQIETGTTFRSAVDAAEKLNISRAHIISACCGKRKTAGGFHWRYAAETQDEWENRRNKYILQTGIKEIPKIVCIETGEMFDQPKIAAESVGVHPSNITKVCSGDQLTAGGYHWKYANETAAQKEKREALIEKNKTTDKGVHSRIRVRCVELDKVFASVQAAANALGINRSGISNALRGAAKTAGGYHWEYEK